MSLQEQQDYLSTFTNYERFRPKTFLKEISLERMNKLLELVGNPEKDLRFIHVAGSKGKGSTSVYIAYILREAGFKVGLYTSPHLYSCFERIRVLNEESNPVSGELFEGCIPEEDFARLLVRMKPHLEALRETKEFGALTYFEIMTALAFLYFKKCETDIVVLETGLGGRLDATNVVDSLVSVITPISFEHTDILGDTLEKIALEKAAIIKSGNLKAVIAHQDSVVNDIFLKQCQSTKVDVVFVDQKYSIQSLTRNVERQFFNVKSSAEEYQQLQTTLLGNHQLDNATTAIAVVESLSEVGFKIPREAIEAGIARAFWPLRFEIVSKEPTIILDGAHNEASTRALVNTLKDYFPDEKATIVLGVSDDKDLNGICDSLKEIADKVIFTKADHPRAKDFEDEHLQQLFPDVECVKTSTVQEALQVMLESKPSVCLVTGSLFVAAEAREVLGSDLKYSL